MGSLPMVNEYLGMGTCEAALPIEKTAAIVPKINSVSAKNGSPFWGIFYAP